MSDAARARDAEGRTRDRAGLDRKIVALAVPAAGSAMLLVLLAWIDMYWVGPLGTDALAALAIASVSVWMFAALGALVGTGVTALVARYVGVGREDAAAYVGFQGLLGAVAFGLATGAAGLVLAPAIYDVSNAAPRVAAMGVVYTRIYWGGGALILLAQAADAVFRGHGNTRVPFAAGLVALVLNAVLDPLLIRGVGPIPEMGVAGAAAATLLATGVAAGLVVLRLARRGFLLRARPDDDRLRFVPTTPLGRPGLLGIDRVVFRRMSRVGAPMAVGGLVFTGITLGMHNVAGRVGGAAAQAGLGVGHRGEGVAYVLCLGWAAAASALVGQALGAGRPDQAARTAWRAVLHAALLSALWGVLLWGAADDVAGLLTGFDPADAAARAHAISYFRIVAPCLAPQAVELVLDGAFGGAGLTLPPMIISTVFAAVRIPLAFLFADRLGYGAPAIWTVIAVTAALRGLVAGLWFARGTWKTRTV